MCVDQFASILFNYSRPQSNFHKSYIFFQILLPGMHQQVNLINKVAIIKSEKTTKCEKLLWGRLWFD